MTHTCAIFRREALKLSFQRSFSEPLGGVAGRVLGVPCTPTVESPPSVSPSLHPSKRSRLSNVNPQKLLSPPQSIEAGSISLPTSPCSESSTLQRTLLLKHARTTDPNSLAVRMETKSNKTLIIDCRPFIAYNVNHIANAINVNCCDRFNRKRLQQGKATLADLATTKEGKEMLKKRTWKEVFVYDECSESLENLPASHTLFLVMNALVEDHREPVMLSGGLRDFQVLTFAIMILKPLLMLFGFWKILINSCRFFLYCKIAELRRVFEGQKSICQGFKKKLSKLALFAKMRIFE